MTPVQGNAGVGGGTPASLLMPKMEFIVLISCYQVEYQKNVSDIFDKCPKKLKLHDQEHEQKFLMSPSCIMLSKDFFLHSFIRERLPRRKRQALVLGCRLLLAKATGPFGAVWRLFSFYLKCPLACDICAGCYVEGGGRKKEKNILPIAFLIPTLLCFLSSPSSKGSFLPKCLAKQKRCYCFCMKNKSLIY